MYRDSGGRVTDQEKAAMARAGGVDLAIVAMAAEYLMPLTARQGLPGAATSGQVSISAQMLLAQDKP